METTIVDYTRGYIGIMENKMETTQGPRPMPRVPKP